MWHCLVLVIFLYFPLDARINCVSSQCRLMSTQYDQLEYATAECKELQHRVSQLHVTLNAYRSNQPKYNDTNMCPVFYITRCIHKAGSKLNTCKAQAKTKKDWYTQQEILCNSSGNMEKIISFFNVLEKSLQLCTCDNFSLTQSSEGAWNLSCKLSYYQISEQ